MGAALAAVAATALLAGTAGVVFVGAVGVFLFGVIVTSGVYGSRMAWLLGVVLPLLVIATLFAGLAAKVSDSSVEGGPGGPGRFNPEASPLRRDLVGAGGGPIRHRRPLPARLRSHLHCLRSPGRFSLGLPLAPSALVRD